MSLWKDRAENFYAQGSNGNDGIIAALLYIGDQIAESNQTASKSMSELAGIRCELQSFNALFELNDAENQAFDDAGPGQLPVFFKFFQQAYDNATFRFSPEFFDPLAQSIVSGLGIGTVSSDLQVGHGGSFEESSGAVTPVAPCGGGLAATVGVGGDKPGGVVESAVRVTPPGGSGRSPAQLEADLVYERVQNGYANYVRQTQQSKQSGSVEPVEGFEPSDEPDLGGFVEETETESDEEGG
jgi:hypothetical protein